ncbi:hypothetical protein KS664_003208 [Clostridium perfringens]|nr:hypothetical protein [Clostridium perfringens]
MLIVDVAPTYALTFKLPTAIEAIGTLTSIVPLNPISLKIPLITLRASG